MKPVLALALISLATASTAYSDGPRSSRADAEATATDTASSASGASSARAGSRAVRFVAADGVVLVGRLSGTGDVGVILAHGFSHGTAQDAWLRFVPVLVSRGYTVMTFNFRGFCDSEGCSEGPSQLGKNWRDAMAAVRFMETRGAKKIFLIGASMGGLAVLRAARMPEVDLSGVVSLSTPQFPSKYYAGEPRANDVTPARLRQIDEPKLFVAGTKDVQLPGTAPLRPGVTSVRFAADARRMFDAAEEPKKLALVDSSFHSSELVTTAPADIVRQTRGAVFRFLSENKAVGRRCAGGDARWRQFGPILAARDGRAVGYVGDICRHASGRLVLRPVRRTACRGRQRVGLGSSGRSRRGVKRQQFLDLEGRRG